VSRPHFLRGVARQNSDPSFNQAPAKDPVDEIVIDRIERPETN
jgi:hypothetical protein